MRSDSGFSLVAIILGFVLHFEVLLGRPTVAALSVAVIFSLCAMLHAPCVF